MDEADSAGEREEIEMALILHDIHAAAPEAAASGVCHNCGEPLPLDQRWCDHYCLEDWELRRRMGVR